MLKKTAAPHFFKNKNRETNTVVDHGDVDLRCRTELTTEVIGQRLHPMFRPVRKWPQIVDNDRQFAVVNANGRLHAAKAGSSRRRPVLLLVLFAAHREPPASGLPPHGAPC